MRILVTDSGYMEMMILAAAINRVKPEAEVILAGDPREALEFTRGKYIDAAFIYTDHTEMKGTELAEKLKEKQRDINIIFYSADDRYMKEAFDLHASGYLIKPVTDEMIERELSDLRYRRNGVKRVRVVTFGEFAVFVDEKPVQFRYSKSEELFAILVDKRGRPVSKEQAAKLLWEDDPGNPDHSSYLSALKKDMITAFSRYGAKRVIRSEDGKLSVVTELLDCDLYDRLSGKDSSKPFGNRYMEQYSWAEATLGYLSTNPDDPFSE